ncbi:MAG: spondin domain-containing protein [Methylococcales bacterium]
MKIRIILFITLLITANLVVAGGRYKVSITNITKGQTFTPQMVATHARRVNLFTLGKAASDSLGILAESGNPEPLTNDLLAKGRAVSDVQTIAGLLAPGQTSTIEMTSRHGYLSVAAMLIPTNDTFMAVNTVRLPRRGSVTYTALGYDAGTEQNDQNCVHIPGPRCDGEPNSPAADTDEGFVYVSNGFHDLGSFDDDENDILGPATYDWRNPVAMIRITRIR